MSAIDHLQAELDRLRTENEELRQAIAAGPGHPKPGATCACCGQVNERGAGWAGRPTELGAPDRDPATRGGR